MPEPSLVRFGVFEVDLHTRELRKHGIRLRLQEQPFQVLQALLERPGELVTREELQRRIWGGDTFVDFEQSLNRAVNKAREVLGDEAGTPRFIETLPRRGYRFIAPVEGAPESPESKTACESSQETAGVSAEESDSRMSRAGVSPGRPRRRWRIPVLVVCGLVAAAAWLLFQQGRRDLAPPRVVQLTSYPGSERFPSFSPDGNQVAFSWDGERGDNSDIYVKLVGEVTALRLTTDPAEDLWPAWSPDGKRIAFQRATAQGDAGIYVVSAVGGAEQRLAAFPATEQMSWSRDAKWLAVRSIAGGIFLLPYEGGEPRRISNPKLPAYHESPAFSPDGRQLAYVGCTGRYSCDLYVQSLGRDLAAVGEPRRITAQGLSINGIAWSRDGESLVYSGALAAGTLGSLWRVRIRGEYPPERIEMTGRRSLHPAIARTGSRLAYSSYLNDTDIWRYEMGGVPGPFIASTLLDGNPQFSPDGGKIAFASNRSGDTSEIWVVNSDGSRPVQLTNGLARFQGTPRWSPDGRWIAFDSETQDGHWDIWVVEAGGGRPRRLTPEPSDEVAPSWSHDGKWIYFASDRTGRNQIWRLPFAGGQAEQVTSEGGFVAFESADGAALFYTKTDTPSPLFTRRLAGGRESVVLERVGSRQFVVLAEGIYYFAPAANDRNLLRFLQFSTGRRRVLTAVEGELGSGLAVSPEGKTFLFGKRVAWGVDLMLIENFR